MQKKTSPKAIIIIVVIIALAGLGYFYFLGDPKNDPSLTLTSTGAQSDVAVEAAKVVTLLNQTSSLKIDRAIFSTPLFTSLVDHTVPVVPQPVGKPNPFYVEYQAPAPAATKSSSTKTR